MIIGSVQTAIRIVNCFNAETCELGITDIANRLGMNKSTVYHLVNTLTLEGVLKKTKNRRYRLGIKILEWSNHLLENQEILSITKPHMRQLVQETNETVHLATLDEGDVVYIDKMESNHSIRIATSIGSRKPSYCTGLGKALLAYQDDAVVEQVIKKGLVRKTRNTITDPEQLRQELARVKEQGYSIDNGENEEGLFCIAVPIYDHTGAVSFAMSISGPEFRLNKSEYKLKRVTSLLLQSTRSISSELGYVS